MCTAAVQEFIEYCGKDTETRDYSDVIVIVHPCYRLAALTVLGNDTQKAILEQKAVEYGAGMYELRDSAEYIRNGKHVCVVVVKEKDRSAGSLYSRFLLAIKAYYKPNDKYFESSWNSFSVARLMRYGFGPSGMIYFPRPYTVNDETLRPVCQLPAALLYFVRWGKAALECRGAVKATQDVAGLMITEPTDENGDIAAYIESLATMFEGSKELWLAIPRNAKKLREEISKHRQAVELKIENTGSSSVVKTHKEAEKAMLHGEAAPAVKSEKPEDIFSETLARISLLDIAGPEIQAVSEDKQATQTKTTVEDVIMMYMHMNEDEVFFHNFIV